MTAEVSQLKNNYNSFQSKLMDLDKPCKNSSTIMENSTEPFNDDPKTVDSLIKNYH